MMPDNKPGNVRLLYVLITCLLLFWVAGIQADDSAGDKSRRLDKLRAEIQVLRSTLQGAYGQKGSLETDLRSAELNIAKHSRALKKLSQQLNRQRGKLRELEQDKLNQQQRLGEQQQALAQQVRASYAMGRQGYVKILLSDQDPTAIGRTLTYYKYFNQARARRISTISNSIIELERLQTDISQETLKLEGLVSQQQQQQQERETEYQSRRQILIRLTSDIDNKEMRLKNLLQDEERLAQLLEKLHKALSDIPPDVGNLQAFGTLRGKLALPANGLISTRFGSSRNTGNLLWQGITISAEEGKEVKAIYHGRVAFADWLRNFGMLIIIDHGDGYMSLYAHNQALYRDVGEWVDQDDVIATIGNSGGQANPGLYFEIRHNGTPADPVQWIKTAGR
jgi:septal ring factor EnvC (AmiA/AmiB activator)